MTVETAEILLVLTIISIQIWVFFSTNQKIAVFKNSIPGISNFNILHNQRATSPEASPRPNQLQNESGSSAIECKINSTIISNILNSINIYLERNKNSVSDFYLMKDITERNLDALEEDINQTISIPLYLGLLGTMLGIVLGLFTMSDLSHATSGKITDEQLGLGISGLLGGVKIAMLASFVGLLLTIINSGWFFKAAKSKVDARKNDFYTFIQTELLPVVNQSLGATFESLQRNLLKFNSEFSGNLNKLSGIFNANYQALVLQERILNSLEQIDVAEVAKYNVKVLKELQISTKEFEKFNIHVSHVNAFVSNSKTLADKIDEIILRTATFKTIADKIDSRLAEGHALITFLTTHFQQLESHKDLVQRSLKANESIIKDSVAEVGHSVSDTFKELRDHIANSSENIKEFTVQEIELLSKALSENKTNLSNLQYLETLSKDLTQFKNSSASQGERIKKEAEDIHKTLDKSVAILNNIQNSNIANRAKALVTSVRGLFNGRNNGKNKLS